MGFIKHFQDNLGVCLPEERNIKQPNNGLNSPIGQEIIMAKNITVLAAGGTPKVLEVSTVQAAYDALEITGTMTATVNGEPAQFSDSLSDFAHVSFAAQVKGGNC